MDYFDCKQYPKKDLVFLAKVNDERVEYLFGKTSAIDEPHFNVLAGTKEMGLFRNLFTGVPCASSKTDRSYLELIKTFPNIDPNNFYVINGKLWAVVEPKILGDSPNSGVMVFDKSKLVLDNSKLVLDQNKPVLDGKDGMKPDIQLVTDGDSISGGKYIVDPDDMGLAYWEIRNFLNAKPNYKFNRKQICDVIYRDGIDYEKCDSIHMGDALPGGIVDSMNYAVFRHNIASLENGTCKEN